MADGTPPFVIEAIGPTEQRMSFRVGDSWCRSSSLALRSGIQLGVSQLEFAPQFAFSVTQPPSELELTVSKGSLLPTHTPDGQLLARGGSSLQIGRTQSLLPTRVRAPDEVRMECISLSLSQARLRELLGVSELPRAFREVAESHAPCSLVSQAMTPRLFGLLDEIVHADASGAARLLWHEAKTLELLALISDEVAETSARPRLSARDVERLQSVARCLSSQLVAPPTLTELARAAGFSETKLKNGFSALFGTSVFAYLRQARLEQARRLLLQRRLNVTEVAQRVGYENPSKFAAAFRRHFGRSPSEV